MEIKNSLTPLDQYNWNKVANTTNQPAQRGVNTPAVAGDAGDRVSLSPEARLRTEALATATNAPDVRAEKVASLKAQVASGEYAPDSKAIASKLLQEEPGLFS